MKVLVEISSFCGRGRKISVDFKWLDFEILTRFFIESGLIRTISIRVFDWCQNYQETLRQHEIIAHFVLCRFRWRTLFWINLETSVHFLQANIENMPKTNKKANTHKHTLHSDTPFPANHSISSKHLQSRIWYRTPLPLEVIKALNNPRVNNTRAFFKY